MVPGVLKYIIRKSTRTYFCVQSVGILASWDISVGDRLHGKRKNRCVCQVTPNQTIRWAESGHQPDFFSRWSLHTRDDAGAKKRGINVGERGKTATPLSRSQSKRHRGCQLLEPLHGAGFSAMPFPHTIYLRTRPLQRRELQRPFRDLAAAVGWSRRGILKDHACILTSRETALCRS